MSNNNPLNVDISGLSTEVAEALAIVIAKLTSATVGHSTAAYAAAHALTEAVTKLRDIGA